MFATCRAYCAGKPTPEVIVRKVFISYARQNWPHIDQLAGHLRVVARDLAGFVNCTAARTPSWYRRVCMSRLMM
jgi:hypothetical protein